ncbi:MAG TPA: hypothetical protein VG013_13720 [Gemmataceae bacterium]|nr:hypothetical protein [Gemmataceae bacterium]
MAEGQPTTPAPVIERARVEAAERACAGACSRLHVRWELSDWHDHLVSSVTEMVQPADLFVFGQALAPAQKKDLLRQAVDSGAAAILICPDNWQALHRVLVLDQGSQANERFLAAAAQLCRCFQAKAVVLTVADSERTARLRQGAAREMLAGCGLDADFDLVVGAEVGDAVANVARWRRCQLVVMERHNSQAWRRWPGHPRTETLIDLTQDLTFLALPESGVAGTVPQRTPAALGPPKPLFKPICH